MRRSKREQVYAVMRYRDTFTAGAIADDCGMSPVSSVRRLLYSMESDGMLEWVQRDPDTERAMVWRLTPSGRARIERGTAG